MAKRVKIIVEKASDGGYSCYTEKEFPYFSLAGYGDTAEEAKKDLVTCYEEMKELEAEEGRTVPEMEFIYKYDIQAFFNCFPFLNISKIAQLAGINPSQMRQYVSGHSHASQLQYNRLRETIKSISHQLGTAAL